MHLRCSRGDEQGVWSHAFVLVYLDNILVFSTWDEEHVVHLQQVFALLRASKLYAKMVKTLLLQAVSGLLVSCRVC